MLEKHGELEKPYSVPQIIDKHQLAELLNLKVSWIEGKCRTKKIPHLLIAGQYRFTRAHINEILAIHERRPVSEPKSPPAPAPPPAPRRRTRQPAPLPGSMAPLRDRGLPTHRLSRLADGL